ncbi:MAG: BlaI/MecI/CopY family transcriptional regulator [Bacteroidota bacterium]
MKRLTKAEEQVMQIIWDLERCTVRDIIEQLGDPNTPHSTISSIVRILDKKGFLGHKAYGRTYEYFPQISKEDYSSQSLKSFAKDYFDGSVKRMVSFLVQENDMDLKELSDIMNQLESSDNKQNNE